MEKAYTSVCDTCNRKTWYETEQRCHVSGPKTTTCKTCNNTTTDKGHKIVRCTGTLKLYNNSDLDERFREFYRTGQRIRVTYSWNEKESFYVGKSTGWKPVWLAIKNKNSSGGSALFSDSIVSIEPLKTYNR